MAIEPRAGDRSAASASPSHRAPDPSTALVHLYRGELGRLTAYRRRLDTTTNWAISLVGAAVSLVLGTDSVPHTVVLMAMILTLFFLILEAGRYRNYEVSRVRVALLERSYFPDVLRGNTDWPWIEPLIDNLSNPRPPMDRWTAIGCRLKRNYLWLYLTLLVAWLFKLELTGGPSGAVAVLVSRASIGWMPGWAVFVGVTSLYLGLIALMVMAMRRYPETEDW